MSMEELAGKLKISRQTLSAIINDTWKAKRISEATYRKTMTLIDQYGYVPYSSAQHLSKTKRHTIGLIYHGNFFSHILTAVQYLNSYFYKEKIAVSLKMTSAATLKEAIKELLGERVEKIIIINTFDNLAERIIEENITPYLQKVSTIIYNYHFGYEKDKKQKNILLQNGISLIGFSRAKIYTELFSKLKNGHYTQLFIEESFYYSLKHSYVEDRLFSFFNNVRIYSQAKREKFEFNEFLVGQNLGEQLITLLSPTEKTVIITDSDMVAEGLANFLTNQKIDIPEHVGLVGFDNLNATVYFKLPLTTIDVPVKEMIANVIQLLKEPENTDPIALESDSRIVYRESLIVK